MSRGRPRSFDRDQALRSAMNVFWERGYDATTLQDLQSAMGGIAPPSFYSAFGSKEALFLEAVDLYRATVGHRPADALEGHATARASIEAMLRESVNTLSAPGSPRGCLLVLGAMNCSSESVQDHLLKLRRQAPEMIKRRLERGVRDGDLPAGLDLAGIAAFYTTVVHGLAVRARDESSRKPLLAAVDGAMAAWDALTTPPTRGSRSRAAKARAPRR